MEDYFELASAEGVGRVRAYLGGANLYGAYLEGAYLADVKFDDETSFQHTRGTPRRASDELLKRIKDGRK